MLFPQPNPYVPGIVEVHQPFVILVQLYLHPNNVDVVHFLNEVPNFVADLKAKRSRICLLQHLVIHFELLKIVLNFTLEFFDHFFVTFACAAAALVGKVKGFQILYKVLSLSEKLIILLRIDFGVFR